MRHLGLDYGAKRVGLALSDEGGRVAFPYAVWPTDQRLLSKITVLCREENVSRLILGDTLDYRGGANTITPAVRKFKTKLEKETGLPVVWLSEIFTSREAKRGGPVVETDARAAALILQSYLDRENRI